MDAVQAQMTGKILYCESCGKLIPPEEAEAEDFAVIGGLPVCPRCLEKDDPKRKEIFDTARSTRLKLQVQLVQQIKTAKAPEQVFPPPGSELADSPTSTQIRVMREELDAEFDAEDQGKAPKAKPASTQKSESKLKAPPPNENPDIVRMVYAETPGGAKSGVFPVLPRRTKLALAALLLLSLAALIGLTAYSLGQRSAVQAEGPGPAAPGVPVPPPLVPVPTVPKTIPAVKKDDPTAQLAYVETLESLLGERPERDVLLNAIGELKPLAASAQPAVHAAATQALQRCYARIDSEARQAARDAAEGAQELADQELFTLATQRIAQAVAALPEASPWAQQSGRRRLQAVSETLSARKEQALVTAMERIENLVTEGKEAEAQKAVADLRAHPEPEFQKAAVHLAKLLDKAEDERKAMQKRLEEAARVAWPKFFRDFDEALAAGDPSKAEALCKPAADAVLRVGGIEAPAEVLAGFAEQSAAVKDLYDAALKGAAAREGSTVTLPPGMGRSKGTLSGVDGRNLVVLLDDKAEMKIAVERLAPIELERLAVHQKDIPAARFRPALWTLVVAKGLNEGNDPARWLTEQYAGQKLALPLCWQRRFDLEHHATQRDELAQKLAVLRKALADKDEAATRVALAALQPALNDPASGLTPADRETIASAGKEAGVGKLRHVIFQNGAQPSPDYVGIQIDQINRYYKNEERTDVDVHEGLKVGSYNDLQRVLIRFDGLETGLGKGRIRKATLELYETEAPKADGAVVALFRLKKAWTPNAGTWKNADQRKRIAWEKGGASGAEDAEDKPDAQLAFDDQKGLWRSWDVTSYIREITEGKAVNNGLLVRVLKDEPKYHIRFYPEGDLDAKKDAVLRPRLVVEMEGGE
ncbi:MAG: DNRLRE domain-containing protein [Planctomycetes bacterium]|nr:DNRLRE domain-containing protein [Planctomycetota bacterium]